MLNLLTIRKEGNITRSNNTNTNNLASHTNDLASCNLNNSQVNTPQGRNHSFPGQPSFSGKYPPREDTVHSQASTTLPLALALPPGEASTPQASALPVKALALPPGKLAHLRQQLSLLGKLVLLQPQLSLPRQVPLFPRH